MKRFTPIIYAYLEQEETAGRISCAAHTVRGVCPLHGHDFYELELILDGRGRQWLNSACVPTTTAIRSCGSGAVKPS